jgi:hypothetical protein
MVTVPNYTDPNYTPGDTYRVTAVNAQGESPYCHVFTPSAAAVASACILPGLLVSNDLTQSGADNDSGANTPPDPRVNARQLFVAEPFVSSTVDNLVFTLFVAPSTMNSAPPNSQWFIIWNRQGTDPSDPSDASFDRLYVAMATDATGSPKFDYGKFGIPINTSPPPPPDPLANTPVKKGNADSGSYDPLTGVITITIAKSKLRAIDGGNTKYQAGSDLAATNVRTYFNRPDYQPDSGITAQRSQNNASDITANGTYTLVGAAACAPVPDVVSAVSRKVHGGTEAFDIKLLPQIPAGNVPVEPRAGGPTTGNHQIVITFSSPVSFTGASVDGGGSATTTPAAGSAPVSTVTVNLSGVPNASSITVHLLGVTAGGASATVDVPMKVLLGDANADTFVNSADATVVRNESGQLTDDNNFRSDINVDGVINSADATIVRNKSGSSVSGAQSAPRKRAQ